MTETTEHVRVALPPPVVALGYLLGAFLLHWALPLRTPWTTALRFLGGALGIAGLLLAAAAIREMRRMGTTPDLLQPVTSLVTTGPYRMTRNPIYLGFLLVFLGFTLMGGTLWGLLLSPFLVVTLTRWVIRTEETYLERKFADEYAAYRAHVRRWL